jgi:hypothetical protein
VHDVGIIVWAAIVVIGMVASIVSTARKAAASAPRPGIQQRPPAAQRPVAAPQWPPQASQRTPPPAPRAAAQAASRAQPPASEYGFPMPSRPGRTIFGDAAGLRRAVIAAEVLGKPLALRDE